MNKVKKLISVLVCMAMLCAVLPAMTVGAATSGTCGDNLTWTLTDDGVLTISGTGDMWDWGVNSKVPSWYSNRSSIIAVVIEDGVTSIGRCAFSVCSGLTSVSIPDSVTTIGYCAFEYCPSLKSVTIPDSVTSISDYAFEGCKGLTSITIPDSVTSIGKEAFENCTGLTNLYITDLAAWCNIDFYDLFSTPMVYADNMYINGEYAESVTIPGSITEIKKYTFYGWSTITSVSIGSGVTTISDYAFEACKGLTSITIPDSVTSIGKDAFENCTGLKDVYITDLAAWCNIDFYDSYSTPMYYADNMYINGEYAESVTIPDSITEIKKYTFYGWSTITSVSIGTGVTSIGSDAFEYCSSLTSVTIPDSVTSIGELAFCDTAYYYDKANWKNGVLYIDNALIEADNDVSGDYQIKEGTVCIADGAFEYCESLTSVEIPNSVTSIGDFAFWVCESLTSVTIPDSVTSISNCAFYMCTALTSVSIPDSVTSIGRQAFDNCNSLTNITIPNSVTSIENYAFQNCTGLTSVSIGSGVTKIGYCAFYGCTGLTSVNIPDSVTSIGDKAFYGCNNIKTAGPIGGGYNIEFGWKEIIPDDAFRDCSSLTSVTIPDSVTSIGKSAFYKCDSLTDVYYSGSEEDWSAISIDDKNECLTSATIHYNSTGPVPEIADVKLTTETDEETGAQVITVTVETEDIFESNALLAVGFGDGGVISVSAIENGEATLPADGVKTVKVFAWESLESMKPLCEAKTVTAQ